MPLEHTTVSELSLQALEKQNSDSRPGNGGGTIKKASQALFHILILAPTVRHDQAIGHKTSAGLIASSGQFRSGTTLFTVFQGPALEHQESTATAK